MYRNQQNGKFTGAMRAKNKQNKKKIYTCFTSSLLHSQGSVGPTANKQKSL